MLQYLKDHWPEIVATSIAIIAVAVLAIAAPHIFPTYFAVTWAAMAAELSATLSPMTVWAIFSGLIAVVVGGFAMGFTNEIRARINNTPDWPWFDGLIEGSPQPSIRDESNEYTLLDLDAPSHSGEENSNEETHDSIALRPMPSSSGAFIAVHSSSNDEPKRVRSVKDRMHQLQTSLQADGNAVEFKHETASTTMLLTKIKEAKTLMPAQVKSAARRGETSTEFVSDMRKYCQNPASESLETLFSKKPTHLSMCITNKLLNDDHTDLTDEAKSAFSRK